MTHLAHRVRRMADAIAAMPSDQKLTRNQELAQHLAGLAALLWEHGDAAFARAADWANTGLVSGGGSGGGSGRGPSRPTEAQALAVELAEPGKQRDQLLEDQAIASYYRWLQFYRAHITELAGPMAKILREVCTLPIKSSRLTMSFLTRRAMKLKTAQLKRPQSAPILIKI